MRSIADELHLSYLRESICVPHVAFSLGDIHKIGEQSLTCAGQWGSRITWLLNGSVRVFPVMPREFFGLDTQDWEYTTRYYFT